jgi:hypothetical protein
MLGGPGFAADDNGDFAIKGAGVLSCQAYLVERANQSNAYYMIGGWLDGYVSALNQHLAGTYDSTSYESTELLMLIIQNHCSGNPGDILFSVVNSIVTNLAADKLTSKSTMVTIRVGEREGRFYEAVLERMQRELERQGLLAAGSEPGFTQQMTDAIKTYQRSIAFDPTGYPDQATLWRLFRGGATEIGASSP